MRDLRFLGVLAATTRAALMTLMQYRSSFLLQVVAGLTTALAVVLPMVFVWDTSATIGGFTLREALLVSAFFLVLGGIVGTLVEPNLSATVEAVRTGTFDHVLLKPVDAQLLCSFRQVQPARLWDVLAGVALGAWAMAGLPPPSGGDLALAAVMFAAGLAAMYGLWLVVISTCFWFVRVDNLQFLLGAVVDTGRWPITIYRGWMRTALTVIVPVALVTSYPTLALLGRLPGESALGAIAVGVGALVGSRWVWKAALRHYSSASS